MQYNIYIGFSMWPKIEYGVDKPFVEKIVNAYLRGLDRVIISGREIQISETNLQIYSIQKDFEGSSEELERFFTQQSQKLFRVPISEIVLKEYGKNVTESFLQGRGFGDLKEDVYNVYINAAGERIVRTVVEKNELLAFIEEWRKGLPTGFLSGKVVPFDNLSTIAIYDIEIAKRQENNGETKKYLNQQVRLLYQGKWTTSALEDFGKDVTSSFNIGAYGSNSKIVEPTIATTQEKAKAKTGKIFISHSSKDKNIVTEFTNEILFLCLGADHTKTFCTSIEGLGITSGEDFRKRIKKELEEAQIVIQIISKDYKTSEVCLNEMGAAWVLAENVIPLVIDGNYDVGFIHSTTHQLNISKKEGVLQFIDDWGHLFTQKAKHSKMNGHVDKFLKAVNEKHS